MLQRMFAVTGALAEWKQHLSTGRLQCAALGCPRLGLFNYRELCNMILEVCHGSKRESLVWQDQSRCFLRAIASHAVYTQKAGRCSD